MSQENDLMDFLIQISKTKPTEFKNLIKSLISFSHGTLDQPYILNQLKSTV